MSSSDLASLVAQAELIAKELKERGAEYLYDGVFVYHDGFQYWLCTEQGAEIALEPKTLKLFFEYLKKRGG